MTRDALTMRAVMDALDPKRREGLLAINPHLRTAVAPSVARRRMVVSASAQRNGSRVDLVAKGLRLDLTPNARLHPMEVARRRRSEHSTIAATLAMIAPPVGPWRVTIVRVGPRVLDDDNRTASAKGVRDAVAAWLGVDDGAEVVRWDVRGEVAKGYAVRVLVEGVPVAAPQEAVAGARAVSDGAKAIPVRGRAQNGRRRAGR